MADERVRDSVMQAAQRLEVAWQSGGNTDLSQYLPTKDSPDRTAMLVQLIKVDQQYRWRADAASSSAASRGEQRLVQYLEQYLKQWPELQSNADAIGQLLESECAIRAAMGDKPTQAELQQRFPTLYEQVDLNTVPIDAGSGDAHHEGSASRSAPGARSKFDTTPVSQDSHPTPHPSWRLSPSGGKVGRYEIRALLGAGGMGEVYRAFDTELQREVALKIPRVEPGAKPEMLDRFVQEALAAASLRHPHICPVYDAGQMDDRYYIVMALIEGDNLAETLRNGPADPTFAVRIAGQLASALHAAHEAGIIHRDIKPANVLIDSSNQPLLTDFGLASRIDSEDPLTAAGSFLGTPAYMSPEQAEMKQVDRRTDVYSLGVVLYQMLTGKLPFPGPPAQLLMQIIKGKPPRPRKWKPELDTELEAICLKAMAHETQQRYQTAAELVAALEEYARPLPVAPVNMRKRVVWSAGVGALLIAVGIMLAQWGVLGGGRQRGATSDREPVSQPLTPRQQQIADLQQQLDSLAPAIDSIAAVRALEAKYIDVKKSVFGLNSQAVGRDVSEALAALKVNSFSAKEAEIVAWLDGELDRDSMFKTPEDSYLQLRELVEMMDVRIVGLQSRLQLLQASPGTAELPYLELPAAPPEQINTIAERDWRLQETRHQLEGLHGVDAEVERMREIEDRWRQSQSDVLDARQGAAVAVAMHVCSARLYALELTGREVTMYRAAAEAAASLNIFSRPEDVYMSARLFAETVSARAQLLRIKLAGLLTWTPAATRYQELLEMQPRSIQVDCDASRVLGNSGKRPEAIEILSKLLEQSPDNVVLYALRATLYIDNQQRDAAQRDVEKVLSLNSELAYGYFVRGYLHAVKEEYTLAVADCDHALQLDPLLVQAYCTRADAYIRVSAFSRAMEDCDEVLRIDPSYGDAYRIRARVWIESEDWDKALEDAQEATRLSPLVAEIHYIHARVLHHNQQYEQALQSLTKAIFLNSQTSDYYRLRADCYENLGNTLRATGDLVRAQRMDEGATKNEDAQQQAAPAKSSDAVPDDAVPDDAETDDAETDDAETDGQ